LDKGKPKPLLFLSITVSSARMLFIRAEDTVGARSAQVRWSDATAFHAPYIIIPFDLSKP
jgi:hypothetical protein